MARPRKPWYRKSRKTWYVEIHGKQHSLGKDKEEAHRKYHELMAQEPDEPDAGSVAEMLDAFVIHCEQARAPATVRWYTDYLQDFLDFLPSPGNSLPSKIQPKDFRAWVDARKTAQRARIAAVKAAFRWGHSEDWIQNNPLSSMRRPQAQKRPSNIHCRVQGYLASQPR